MKRELVEVLSQARNKMVESSANAESLEVYLPSFESPELRLRAQAIDSAMFVICLEDHVPVDYVDQQNSFLHGSAKNRSPASPYF